MAIILIFIVLGIITIAYKQQYNNFLVENNLVCPIGFTQCQDGTFACGIEPCFGGMYA